MIYQLLVFYILTMAFFYMVVKKAQIDSWEGRGFYLIPVFVAFFFVMGCRSTSVGVDTYTYSQIYRGISNETFSVLFSGFFYGTMEIGFAILAKISSFIIDDYYFFQLVISFLFCFFIYKFIYANSVNFITASIVFLSVGIYLASFNITRQMLAVSIAVNAWTYQRNGNYKMVVLLSLLAITFHVSAVVSLLVYVVYYFRDNRKSMKLLFIFLIVFVFVFQGLMSVVSEYFTVYNNYYANNREIQEAHIVKVLWFIELMISLYIFYKKKIFDSEKQFIALMCMVYVVANFIALSFNYLERVGLCFSPFLLLLFEIYGNSLKNKQIRYGYYMVVNTCFLIYFLRSSSSGQYIYTSFLNFL